MNPISPNPLIEQVAVEFVQRELAEAHSGLRRAKMLALISVGLTAAYLGSITYILSSRLLEPQAAARFATDNVRVLVHTHGHAWSQQLVQQIPVWISQAPDELLAELPRMRQELENQVVAHLTCHARAVAPVLVASVDELLAENESVVREFLHHAEDEETRAAFGDELEHRFWAALNLPDDQGVSAADRLRSGLEALSATREQVHRLAHASNLSPDERRLRRIIGLVLQHAHASRLDLPS